MVVDRFLEWLLYAVLASLLPLLVAAGNAWQDHRFAWSAVAGHGELLLISVAIGAPAVGLVMGRASGRLARTAGGLALLSLIAASLAYQHAAVGVATGRKAFESALIFGVAVVTSAILILATGNQSE